MTERADRFPQLRALRMLFRLLFQAAPGTAVTLVLLEPVSWSTIPLSAFGVKILTDGVVAGSRGHVVGGAVVLGVLIAALYIGGIAGAFLRRTAVEKVNEAMDAEVMALVSGVPTLAPFEDSRFQDKIELIRQDKQSLGASLEQLPWTLISVARLLVLMVLLGSIHPLMALLPLLGLVSLPLAARSHKRHKATEDDVAVQVRHASHLFEVGTTPASGGELRVFGMRDALARRHRASWDHRVRLMSRVAVRDAVEQGALDLVLNVGSVVALVVTVMLAAEGRATAGDVAMVLLLAFEIGQSAAQVVGSVGELAKSLRSAERFLWLRDFAEEMAARHRGALVTPAQLSQGITLDGVSFSYGTEDSRDCVSELSVHLPAGQVVAIVGENGAGKSTLVKLLTGLHLPAAGVIKVDGVDLADLDLAGWRGRIGAAFQDFARFEIPAGEVIGVGDLPNIDDAIAIARAASRGGADAVLEQLPEGVATMLGPSWEGAELSGGQWQRLALARGLMRSDPLLVVFDEPTSALDAETEHALFRGFLDAARSPEGAGAVHVIVSHRFSTVRAADLILVLDGGRLVEQGTHEELMATEGPYAELFTIQAAGYQ